MLMKFWQIEEIPSKPPLSPDDQFCEDYFVSSVTRNAEGRFVVRLPIKPSESHQITASKEIAATCLLRSEKRRSRDQALNNGYVQFMREYVDLGHMRPATPLETQHAHYYIPHHGVFKTGSQTIRVVFNASQKGSNGVSFNDILLPGPKLQADITAILTRWRFFKFVFTADIVKMFRQILVHPDDQC